MSLVLAVSSFSCCVSFFFFFFFNDTATTEIYTLSLHDALPIFILNTFLFGVIILIANILKRAFSSQLADIRDEYKDRKSGSAGMPRPISYAVFCLKKKKKKPEKISLTNNRQMNLVSQHSVYI